MSIYIQKVNLFQLFRSFLNNFDIKSIYFDIQYISFSILSGHNLISFVMTIIDPDPNSSQIFNWNPRRLQNLSKFRSRSTASPKLTSGPGISNIETNIEYFWLFLGQFNCWGLVGRCVCLILGGVSDKLLGSVLKNGTPKNGTPYLVLMFRQSEVGFSVGKVGMLILV